ncbi:hypothetical protein ACHAPT_005406 [Fusarium lateritium]
MSQSQAEVASSDATLSNASVTIIITPPTPLDDEPPHHREPLTNTPLPSVAEEKEAHQPNKVPEEENEPKPSVDASEKEVYKPAQPDASEKEVYEPKTADAAEKEVYQPGTQAQQFGVEEKEVYDPKAESIQAAIDASEKEVYHFETEAQRADTSKEVCDGSTHVPYTQQTPDVGKEVYTPETTHSQPDSPIEYTPEPAETQTESQASQPKRRFKKLQQAVGDRRKKAWETFTDQSNAIINEQLAWIEKTQNDVTNSIVTGATTRYARLEKGTNTRFIRMEQSINDQMARAEQRVQSYARIKDSIPGLKKEKAQSGEAEKPT